MRKLVLSILFLGLVAAAGYYFFSSKLTSSNSVAEILPETSLFTFHLNQFSANIEDYRSFESAEMIPGIEQLMGIKEDLDSLNAVGEIPSSILNLESWVSVHSDGSDGLNTLFTFRSAGFDWNAESIQSIFQMLTGQSYDLSTQIFNGETIYLLQGEEQSLSFGISDSFLFWSSESLLVEDVIRAINDPAKRLFTNNSFSQKDLAYPFYLNGKRLSELSRIFIEKPDRLLSNVNAVYAIDLKEVNGQITFNGIANEFNSQVLGESQLFAKNLVSIESAFAKWYPLALSSSSSIAESLTPQALQIGLEDGEEVWIVETSDTVVLYDRLNQIAVSNLTAQDSTVYAEEFMFTRIGFIGDDSFLETLSPDLPQQSFYYCFFQNYWLLSNSVDALKTALSDFDDERTLGRDVATRRSLDDMVQETSYTLIKNFNFGSEVFENQLRPKWIKFFSEESGLKNKLNQFTLQANNVGNKSLILGSMSFNEFNESVEINTESNTQLTSNTANVTSNLFAQGKIITKPFVVRNHVNGEREVIFQDETNRIYLSNLQGEILWDKQLEGSVLGNISQIDFYNNKKLQYLFVTDSLLHLIDRNGNAVEGFPVAIQTKGQIENLRVVDYDNSKRYRYLLEGNQGSITLLDKSGNPLEGWNPKSYTNPLQFIPFHTRVRGRDCFVIVDYLGNFDLLNRRAESYAGFPVQTDLRLSGDVFFQKGPNFNGTAMVLLGRDGRISTVNFSGQIIDKKQLFKPDAQTSFELLKDVSSTTYRILQKSAGGASILDQAGESLFSVPDYQESDQVTYYNFRNGKGVYAFRNTQTNTLKLLNEKGEALANDIDCEQPISILFYQSTQQYQVFVNFTNQLTQYTIDAI